MRERNSVCGMIYGFKIKNVPVTVIIFLVVIPHDFSRRPIRRILVVTVPLELHVTRAAVQVELVG